MGFIIGSMKKWLTIILLSYWVRLGTHFSGKSGRASISAGSPPEFTGKNSAEGTESSLTCWSQRKQQSTFLPQTSFSVDLHKT
jgi:hypothetical protein